MSSGAGVFTSSVASSDIYSITFVSAYFTLKETPYFTHSNHDLWDPELLMDIVSIGVPVCLYIGKDCPQESLFLEWETSYPNFRVMPYRADYRDSWVHLQCTEVLKTGIAVGLPTKRNFNKDTYEYLVYMNSRVELMEDAISENIWDTTHFAWVDFNITKLFKHKEPTLAYLANLANREKGYLAPSVLAMPGCWSKPATTDSLGADISWRFCGGFFMGDEDSLYDFGEKYRDHFATFLEKYRVLPWEVNFWAYLESAHGWNPTWYKGDHNDTMVHVSADVYTPGLSNKISSKIAYDYPDIPGFYPGSASYVFHGGKHWLNTRYVSYWMYPNGYYRFHTSDRVIENRNVVSELDPATMTPVSTEDNDAFEEMSATLRDASGGAISPTDIKTVSADKSRHFSEGLEDIRLYSLGDRIRFVATTVNYSPNGRPRIMVGTYLAENREYRDCRIIQPPTDTWCEKNWIPLTRSPTLAGEGTHSSEEEEWFVYKWWPFELGRVDAGGTLRIEHRFDTPEETFSKIRGSSTFTDYGDGQHLVGVVHFSEEHTPRHYYHMLVLLERETFRPTRYSRTFYFEKLSIEFCIGFTAKLEGQAYGFWISRFDRDPLYVEVAKMDIPLEFAV